ncbi:MAG TPA: hypothetical protein VNW99_01515 [Cytophagaceae bacterium]|jgi:hypothetical protein|nr:hypothetical protein [Cytophagaceae bacterium]
MIYKNSYEQTGIFGLFREAFKESNDGKVLVEKIKITRPEKIQPKEDEESTNALSNVILILLLLVLIIIPDKD